MIRTTLLRSTLALNQRARPTGLIAAALTLAALGTSCVTPVQVPAQRPNQPASQTFVDQLRDLIRRPIAPSVEIPLQPREAPEPLPAVNWPALGAGDFEPVAARFPAVVWPAPGAGDFAPMPAALPAVNWPALGAGDFEPVAARFPAVVWPAPGAGDFEVVK